MLSFRFDEWEKTKEIGLVCSPVGCGKTYAAVNQLPQLLNVPRSKTLILSPRVGIKEQTLEQYSEYAEPFSGLDSAFAADKVKVTTVHQIGNWYQACKPFAQPQLVIIDEFHTLFAENCFASPLLYFQQQLEEWVKNPVITVIALTATAKLPLEHVESGFKFRQINDDAEPRYKAESITVEVSKSLETILKQCPATQERKQLVFVRGSAKRLIDLAAGDDCSSWLCSKSSNTRNDDGEKIASLMNQEHYEAFMHGEFPDGVNRLFLTSAFREGINIHDEAAQEIIIEGCTDIEIIQSFGRVRHDTKRLIVTIDKRKFGGFDESIEAAEQLLESGDLETYFEQQLEQEQEDYDGEKVPVLVYEDMSTHEMRFNAFAVAYWIYERECYRKATTEAQKLPYFENMLNPYSKNGIQYDSFNYKRNSNLGADNLERLESFNWSEWLGKELWGEAAKDFSNSLGLRNKDGSIMALSGVYSKWPEYFESKGRKRRDGAVPIVYQICYQIPERNSK